MTDRLSDDDYNRIDTEVEAIRNTYYRSMVPFLLSVGELYEPNTTSYYVNSYEGRNHLKPFSERYPSRASDPLYIAAIDADKKREFLNKYGYYDNFIEGVTTDMYKKYLEMKKYKELERFRRPFSNVPGQRGGGKKKLSKKKRKTRRNKKKRPTRKA